MKISNSILSTVRIGYLYDNGKLVLVHEEKHKKVGILEWVTIHETGLRMDFVGRIIMKRSAVRFLTMARTDHVAVRARAPDLKYGSDNTKKAGIAIGFVNIMIGPDSVDDCLHFTILGQTVLSQDFTLQEDVTWSQNHETRWGDYPVAATYTLEKQKQLQRMAA